MRSVMLSPIKRTWLLPRVTSGTLRPQSKRGATTTRTRGAPRTGRMRRTSVIGLK